MDIQSLVSKIRGTREFDPRKFLPEALTVVQQSLNRVYVDIGYKTDLLLGQAGIKIATFLTTVLQIIDPTSGHVYADIRPGQDRLEVLVNQAVLKFLASGQVQMLKVTPSSIEFSPDPDAGATSFSTWIALWDGTNLTGQFTFLSPSGDVAYLVNVTESLDKVQQQLLAGAASIDSQVIDTGVGPKVASTQWSDGSKNTTVRYLNIQTPRLGVDATPPTTDGYATIGARLGIGQDPTKELDVVGDAEVSADLRAARIGIGTDPSVTLDVNGNAHVEFDLDTLNLTITSLDPAAQILAHNGSGFVQGATPADTRTYIDVYSKAEVDALLAGKADTGSYTTSTDSGHSHSVTI